MDAPDPRTSPKRITLTDLAKAAGVSIASASFAVNGKGTLGDARRAHILKVAEDLGYRQNLVARAIRTGRTSALGLVMPDMSNSFFPGLAQKVVQRARQNGYGVLMSDTGGDQSKEEDAILELFDHNVDGIVWFPVNDKNSIARLVPHVPIIVLDRTIAGFDHVQADYVEGGRLAIEHLLELGHRSIGIIAGPMDAKSMRDRIRGARAALAPLGKLAFLVENSISVELQGEVREAISSGAATAIFCGSDLIAVGALRHARQMGVAVPERLSIVGFDDIVWSEYSSPALTTIKVPFDQMAEEAVETLIRKLGGEQGGNGRVIFKVSLVVRESTAPPAS